MASVILELLEAEGRGTYQHGKLCFPEWAPEVRKRVRNKFASALASRTSVPILLDDDCATRGTAADQQSSHSESTIISRVSEADELASHIEELS